MHGWIERKEGGWVEVVENACAASFTIRERVERGCRGGGVEKAENEWVSMGVWSS